MPFTIPKKKCVLTTSYFPNIWYFAHLFGFEEVSIEINEHYQKRSLRNKAIISGPNNPVLLSIPLRKGKNDQLVISKVEMAFEENWQSQHWNSIQTAYGKTPFFEHYKDEVRKMLILKEHQFLFDFNNNIIHQLLDLLMIECNIRFTDSYHTIYAENTLDLRTNNLITKGSNSLGLTEVIYPQPFDYKQPFHSNLSILDLLFSKGPETILLLEAVWDEIQVNKKR